MLFAQSFIFEFKYKVNDISVRVKFLPINNSVSCILVHEEPISSLSTGTKNLLSKYIRSFKFILYFIFNLSISV